MVLVFLVFLSSLALSARIATQESVALLGIRERQSSFQAFQHATVFVALVHAVISLSNDVLVHGVVEYYPVTSFLGQAIVVLDVTFDSFALSHALVELVVQHFFGYTDCRAELVKLRDPIPASEECFHLTVALVAQGFVHLPREYFVGAIVFWGIMPVG